MAEFCKPNEKNKTCTPITLYSLPSCGYCAAERGLLKGLQVPFKEISVNSKERLSEVVRLTGQTGAPVLIVGNRKVIGYDPKKIRSALKIRRKH